MSAREGTRWIFLLRSAEVTGEDDDKEDNDGDVKDGCDNNNKGDEVDMLGTLVKDEDKGTE